MRAFFGRWWNIDGVVENTYAIILSPIVGGWAVCLTDGREVARFRGPGARSRALRYLRAQLTPHRRTLGAPALDND